MSNRKIIIPPIKCQGIKSKLADWILDNVQLKKGEKWIEPFMGSGVIGFNLMPESAVFADINPHLINFYNAVKKGEITSKIARDFLESEGEKLREKGQTHYYFVRERFNETKQPLDFLFLNRSCFNGIIRFNRKGGFNVPFGHKPQRFAKAYVTKICNQIANIEKGCQTFDWNFICQDFRQTIENPNDTSWIYCDPPYFGRHADYFNSWAENEENELFELLKKTSAKFILSTWHSNKYRHNLELEKYSDKFEVVTKEHFYHVGAKELNRNSMTEAIVINYPKVKTKTATVSHQSNLFA